MDGRARWTVCSNEMPMVTVTLVVAMGANRVIGDAGGLPWKLPEDLAHFKRVTLGHPMIMGRATYESVGKALPGRRTIVVTANEAWTAPDAEVAHSLDAALQLAAQSDSEVFLVGGARIYEQALQRDLVDFMWVTRVAAAPNGDTYFPAIDWQRWREVGRVGHIGPEPERIGFDIVAYERS